MTNPTHSDDEYLTYESLPPILKDYNQWVVWKKERRNGKIIKVPYNAKTDLRASTKDPKTWTDFEQAFKLYRSRDEYLGLGFVFTKGDPFIGLDWDHIRDNRNDLIDQTILTEEILPIGSYAELSPSRTGVHTIAIGSVPGESNKSGNREMYDTGRFFTMTGWHIEGTPITVEKVSQDPLNLIYQRIVGDRAPQKIVDRASLTGDNSFPVGRTTPLEIGDEGIIAQCLVAKNSVKFRELFECGSSKYGSHSEADMALCGILIFFTQDPAQIDRIFRQSSLYRSKWDEMRGSMTYGMKTILEVLRKSQGRESYYTKSTVCPSWRIKDRKTFVKGTREDIWQT